MNKILDKNITRNEPNTIINAKKVFDISKDMEIPGYAEPDQYVPEIDPNYHFDEETTLAILAGFKFNRRVIKTGLFPNGSGVVIEKGLIVTNFHVISDAFNQNQEFRLLYSDKEIVNIGKSIYLKNCASCHGKNLEGQKNWQIRLMELLIFGIVGKS